MQVRPGAPGRIVGAIVRVVTRPVQFYRTMPRRGGFLEPWRFLIAISLIDAILDAVFLVTVRGGAMLPQAGSLLVVVPIVFTLTSFVFSGVLYALWWLMGSSQSYETAYRVFAYTSAITPITTVIGFIPFLGIVGIGWWFAMLALAGVYVHGIKPSKSFVVFGVLAVAAAVSVVHMEHRIVKLEMARLPKATREHLVTRKALPRLRA